MGLTPASFGQSLIEKLGSGEVDSASASSGCVSTLFWNVTVAILVGFGG